MLQQKILAIFGLSLTVMVFRTAQLGMSLSSSSSPYSLDGSEEQYTQVRKVINRRIRNVNAPLASDSQKISPIRCILEQLPYPFYKLQDHIRSDAYHCLRCQNIILSSAQTIEIEGQPKLKYIMFENSKISVLSEGVFANFANFTLLYRLYLNDSFVNTIESGAFIGLTVLEELYIQNNNITQLLKKMFTFLPHLKLLNLANNNIVVIDETVFTDLLSLRDLYLNNNNISIILDNTFNSLKQLRHLDLSNNHIVDLYHVFFYTLGTIDLRNNNLTTVDFSYFPLYLEQIFLDNNQINYIENLKKIENANVVSLTYNNISEVQNVPADIVHLNFSRNGITRLSPTLFKHTIYLTTLDFSYNLMENLNQHIFGEIANIKELYFQHNLLTALPDGCFKTLNLLQVLNLSSNCITDFKLGTFAGLTNLERLDISNNRVAFLYENSFYGLKNLKVLNIAGNLLTSLDLHDITVNSQKLTTITLDNNPWVCKYLSVIVKALEKANINITKNSKAIGNNINGIPCYDHIQDVPPTTPTFPTMRSNIAIDKLQTITAELKLMREFFDQDFMNTSFYRYFETFKNIKSAEKFDSKYISTVLVKHIDDGLKNTSFYKYFSSPSILKSLTNMSENSLTSSRFTANIAYAKDEAILLKISELQTGITIVMIIVIVMLLSFIILIILHKMSKRQTLIHKSVFRKRNSSSEIELI